MSKTIKHLYIIGNGFDCYHGADSGYLSFRKYLYRRNPSVEACFDLFFGPKSVRNSFVHKDDWWWCYHIALLGRQDNIYSYPQTTWAKDNLWWQFEKYLSELNREKIFDILDARMPQVDEGDEHFRYSDFYIGLDEISNIVMLCTHEMKFLFHKWVNTIQYGKGFRKRMLALDNNATFLTFNYTLFLETEYGIPRENILYIHGCRRDKYGSLVLGHNTNDDDCLNRWIHKNKNRKRYRHIQKDRRGRYFLNDKLAYLAYFAENKETANWRLTTRYYAAEEALERFEYYYAENYKNTHAIIEENRTFFDSLGDVELITVIGHSLSDVDMDYFLRMRSVLRDDVKWRFSYHSANDKQRIKIFCNKMRIKNTQTECFEL